jgi:hypothetical protein
MTTTNKNTILDIKKTLKIDTFNDDGYLNNTVSLFSEYNSFTTHKVNCEINSFSTIFFLFGMLSVFSYIPFPVVGNLSILIILGYNLIYNNINSKLGTHMTVFLGSIYTLGNILGLFISYSSLMITSIICVPISLGAVVLGIRKYEKKSHKELLQMKYELVVLAPLHSYIFLENKYNIKNTIHHWCKFLLNYVKKFSTSDVISDELKSRGVDDLSPKKKLIEEIPEKNNDKTTNETTNETANETANDETDKESSDNSKLSKKDD